MEALFATNESDLRKLFDVIQEERIQDICSLSVYYRGVDYFRDGHVISAELDPDNTRLTATVQGSRNYSVQLSLKKGKLEATCTCHQDSVCKHMVASILYAISENIDEATLLEKSDPDIRAYLEKQSREVLVDLLIKYAHDDLLTVIRNKQLGGSGALKIFSKAKRKLDKIFDDDVVCNDPDEFERSLMAVLGTLSGLETKLPKELSELVVHIISRVEEATDEGLLYDHYRDYNFEPSEEFHEFVVRIAKALDFNEKLKFIETLEHTISISSYSTFQGTCESFGKFFADQDTHQLRTYLLKEYRELPETMIENYYGRVAPMLSTSEKEELLTVLAGKDDSRAIELAELLDKVGKRKKSIPMLRRLVSKGGGGFTDDGLYTLYLDQMNAEKLDLREAAILCMKKCPKGTMLRKVAELIPSESAACEQILEKERPGELLNYLESLNRDADALSLVKRSKSIWGDRKFAFYKRAKKNFPQESTTYFRQLVNENLKNTGDEYYHLIADALKHMKQVDKASADELILNLYKNYKRRRNLMTAIQDI